MVEEGKQKNLVILGAASGIGRATARAFSKAGYGIALGDINAKDLDTLRDELTASNKPLWTSQVDASIPAKVASFVEGASNALGNLDVLVYSVGIVNSVPIVEMSTDEWDRQIAVNLNGAFYCAQAVVKQMIRQRSGGVLIFVSSVGAIWNSNLTSAYSASKAGLNMLVRCLSSELGNYRIRANAVMPGVIETSMSAQGIRQEKYKSLLKASIPTGRWGQPEEVADLIEFLASDRTYHINGQSIAIDGGHTVRSPIDWFPLDYTKSFEVDWAKAHKYPPFKKSGE